MFEVITVLSGPFWSGVATTLSVITALIAIYRFTKRKGERCFFEVKDYTIVDDPRVNGVSIAVTMNGVVGSSLHKRTFFMVNRSTGAIDDTDLLGGSITIPRDEGTIYLCNTVKLPSSCRFDAEILSTEINVKNLQCPRGSSIFLEIWHDGCVSGQVSINTKGGLNASSYKISDWRPEIDTLFALAFVVWIIFAALAYLDGTVEETVGKAWKTVLTFSPFALTTLALFLQSSKSLSWKLRRAFVRTQAEIEYMAHFTQEKSNSMASGSS